MPDGDAESEYQRAYHYFCHSSYEDADTYEEMLQLLRNAAAKNHPDAIWHLATREIDDSEINPEYQRRLLRAGQLGSVPAQRALGVLYATGEWAGPKDLTESARWYRLAAEKGEAESQYDLGFMLLLGEGEPKNVEEGLLWLERAGTQGHSTAFRLLVDCYQNGCCEAPLDTAKAELWRSKLEEYDLLHPLPPSRSYVCRGTVDQPTLACLWEIDGVTGYGANQNRVSVSYDPARITPEELDEHVQAVGLAVIPEP
jgi:TPR repeat protein